MSSAVPTRADAETISDEALLRRYAERRDPAAFAELAHRRAGLVFGVCLRITADRHDAEELTQDCFLQLARKAATIQTSVAGWLHQVATHRALNAVRSRGRRRAREARAATVETETTETAWSEVEPLLDEAVDGLPADVREAIILHFLQSLSQEAVAQRLGVHQSTVSRRIDRGLHLLRERLLASGVAMSAAPLSALLAAASSTPGSPNLAEAIGKIALAGAGTTGGLFGWLGISWANVKAWAALAGAAVFPVLVQLMAGGWHGFLAAVLMTLYLAWRRPAWLADLTLAPGGRVYDNPFFPFQRWTWTTPPQNWRERLFATLMAGLMMGGFALVMTLAADRPAPGIAAMFLFYAVIPLSTAARIVIRVVRFRNNEHREPAVDSEPPVDAVGVVQGLCFIVVGPLMLVCVTVANIRLGESRVYTIGLFLIFITASIWGIVDTIPKLLRYRRSRQNSISAEARTTALAPPAKGTVVVLAYLLLSTALFTMTALFTSLPALGATSAHAAKQAAAIGYTSPLSLMFLSVAIRPLARLRGTTPHPLWRFAVAVAAFLALVNLVLCVVWLLPQG